MTAPTPLRVGILGCGFWSQYQIAGWLEVPGVEIVGLWNRTRSKAEALSQRFGAPVFDTPEALLTESGLGVADIITNEETHKQYTLLAADHGVEVICQKPMASTLDDCRKMVARCDERGVRLFIHDNWRWQTPLRRFKEQLDLEEIGRPFRAQVTYANSFPVFEKQPFLAELERFILMDIGTHILDTVRALFGEARTLLCHTEQITPGIKGEDVATLLLEMESGLHCSVHMSYASPVEHDRFPETFVHVEADGGSLELAPDYWIRQTVNRETTSFRAPPPIHDWADPAYALAMSSIVPANRDFAAALRGERESETTGASYLKSMELVFAAYESAGTGQVVALPTPRS